MKKIYRNNFHKLMSKVFNKIEFWSFYTFFLDL